MKEEEAYSILDIISESEGQSVILTRSGSICVPFELRQPECYSLSPEDIDERDRMYREAFRHMPDGTYVHKQDVFLKKGLPPRQRYRFFSWTVPMHATLKGACTSTIPVSCILYLRD